MLVIIAALNSTVVAGIVVGKSIYDFVSLTWAEKLINLIVTMT